jgi:phage terminase large subunit
MAKQKLTANTIARRSAERRKPELHLTSREILEGYVGRFGTGERVQKRIERDGTSLNFKRHLFKEQLDFIDDPSRRKAALCSRRAGKSFAVSRYLLQESLDNPGTMCVYIARTREAAKRILWNMLKEADRQYRLGMKFNNSTLIAVLPNGSEILFTGANDAADVDKLRGAAFSLAVLDEAAFFNIDLQELVREVLSPALLDVDGTLAMISTPNNQCAGLFYDITELEKFGYSTHRWTIKENPHMSSALIAIDRDIKNGVLNPTEAAYKREYLGLWMKDDRSVVYKYSDSNIYKDLPENVFWEYILGIDLGYHDDTAFVVGAFSDDLEELYVVAQYKQKNMLTSDVEDMIRSFQKDYNLMKIVMDTGGGSSKMLMETFKQRTGLPIEHAKKNGDKLGLIKMINSDLARGLIKVRPETPLLNEWNKLQYNLAGNSEDKRFDNHLSDAMLYMWGESRHFLYEEKLLGPKFGTVEYYKQLEDKLEERLLEEQASEGNFDERLWGNGYSEADAFYN